MSSAADAMRSHADALAQAPRRLAQAGADALLVALTQELTRDTGGDRRLSNLAARAPEPDVKLSDDGAMITASGSVWSILESGTSAHTIARKGRSRALRIGEEWRTGPVRVRGARAKNTYSKAIARATPQAMDAQRAAWEQIHR